MNPPGLDFKIHHLKALFDWIVSKGETPYLVACVDFPGNVLPSGFCSESGTISLNIAPDMVTGLTFGLETGVITMGAVFGGKSHLIRISAESVASLSSNESKQGEAFTVRYKRQSPSRLKTTLRVVS